MSNYGIDKSLQAETVFESTDELGVEIGGITQDGKLVFPYTHSSAILGPMSNKGQDINNEIYNNNWNTITENGWYYSSNHTNSTGRPDTSADGAMLVIRSGDYICQLWFVLGDYDGYDYGDIGDTYTNKCIYWRCFYSTYNTIPDWEIFSDTTVKSVVVNSEIYWKTSSVYLEPGGQRDVLEYILTEQSENYRSSYTSYSCNLIIHYYLKLRAKEVLDITNPEADFLIAGGDLLFRHYDSSNKVFTFEGIVTGKDNGTTYNFSIVLKYDVSSDTFTITYTRIENEPVSALPEVKIDTTEPTEENITLWVDTTETSLTEKDIPKTSTLTITEITKNITLPINYTVGNNSLEVYYDGEKLIKATKQDGTDGHYLEIGTTDNTSNEIQITDDWDIEIRKCI